YGPDIGCLAALDLDLVDDKPQRACRRDKAIRCLRKRCLPRRHAAREDGATASRNRYREQQPQRAAPDAARQMAATPRQCRRFPLPPALLHPLPAALTGLLVTTGSAPARGPNLGHAAADLGRIGGAALESRLDEDPIRIDLAMAVGEPHLGGRHGVKLAAPVERIGAD